MVYISIIQRFFSRTFEGSVVQYYAVHWFSAVTLNLDRLKVRSGVPREL